MNEQPRILTRENGELYYADTDNGFTPRDLGDSRLSPLERAPPLKEVRTLEVFFPKKTPFEPTLDDALDKIRNKYRLPFDSFEFHHYRISSRNQVALVKIYDRRD